MFDIWQERINPKNMEKQHRIFIILLGILLIILSSHDLVSPLISKTIWRQTQTAMLTDNFLNESFSFKGLYLNIYGNEKPLTIYEFPVYNFIVGSLYLVLGPKPIIGKMVSLICSLFCLVILIKIIRRKYGVSIALLSGFFFVMSPIGLMMYTAFQPDMLGLMFLLLSMWLINNDEFDIFRIRFILFSIALLIAGLAKYPLLVPYLPVLSIVLYSDMNKSGRFDFWKGIILCFVFVIPLISWYFCSRAYLTDIGRSPDIIDDMFLIGNLSRFFSGSYYMKVIFSLIFLSLSGAGIYMFILGLRNMDAIQRALIAGIPLYFIIIPTVRDQWYYLSACIPIFSFFMAKGFYIVIKSRKLRQSQIITLALIILYLSGFIISSNYTLKKDWVSWNAAMAMRQISQPNDLVFFINMHDRGNGIGGQNPTLAYLSQRKGWNIQPEGLGIDDILIQINSSRAKGAKWILITYYTRDLEPWISSYVPREFHRDPKISYPALNIYEVIDTLKNQTGFKLGVDGRNYLIFKFNA